MTVITLPPDWYDYVVCDGVDTSRPGIYEWTIEGAGSYIGRYSEISRPTKAYGRHVRNLLNNVQAYRPSNSNGYRRIHRELERAHREGRRITLTILENPECERLNERERELIAERGTLNGRVK